MAGETGALEQCQPALISVESNARAGIHDPPFNENRLQLSRDHFFTGRDSLRMRRLPVSEVTAVTDVQTNALPAPKRSLEIVGVWTDPLARRIDEFSD